jgi:hypothetical protein
VWAQLPVLLPSSVHCAESFFVLSEDSVGVVLPLLDSVGVVLRLLNDSSVERLLPVVDFVGLALFLLVDSKGTFLGLEKGKKNNSGYPLFESTEYLYVFINQKAASQ